MYIAYIEDKQVEEFINTVAKSDVEINTMIVRSIDGKSMNAYTDFPSTFNISDFKCIDIMQKQNYSKQWRTFMIKQLDKIDRRLADRYINDMHDHLEQGTIVGPAF